MAGDVATLRDLLANDPGLVHARNATGATALHAAAAHADALHLLLEHGADPNARDEGDHALPLHFAAGGGHLAAVRALLDAGSDVHGAGDLHALDVIGWATVFGEPHRDVVDLLVARGARHHVFSAIALGDDALLRRVVAADPAALGRRLSAFEQQQTALHYVIAPPDGLVGGTFRTGAHYRTLATLLELGVDVEATDAKGRTPLVVAMLRGDRAAMRLLHAAGATQSEEATQPVHATNATHATQPTHAAKAAAPPSPAALRASIGKLTPMLAVADMRRSIAWYEAVGFVLTASHGEDGVLDWAAMTCGEAELMFVPAARPSSRSSPGAPRAEGASMKLWLRTDRLDELYASLRQRQLEHAHAMLAGRPAAGSEIRFSGDLHTTFYHQREFSIRDPDGVELIFHQPLEAEGP
jgi:catechol 2,3-dioxygenase-like lactoylglutathione lyase family enzyme